MSVSKPAPPTGWPGAHPRGRPRAASAPAASAADHARNALLALCQSVAAHPSLLRAPQVLSAFDNAVRAISGAPWPASCDLARRDLLAAGDSLGDPAGLADAVAALDDATAAASRELSRARR